ncbi:MAG: transketolase [Bacteroidota bacterium]
MNISDQEIKQLEEVASQVRRDIVRMVHSATCGHPGGSLGCTDYLVALYFKIMNRKPGFDMDGIGEDLFFLSNGHVSPLFYSILSRSGYFPTSEMPGFRKLGSILQGHPTTHVPGVRMASGSLGQGLSVAIGAALSKKYNNDPSLVFSLHGDGELQEGQNWEAALFAPHHKVDNLIACIDYNGQQIDGPTEKIMSLGNLKAKFEAFNWEVIEEPKGNDMRSVIEVILKAKALTGKGRPVCIILTTQMGYGIDFMMGSHKWHGVAPNDEQLAVALAQLPETLGDY